MTVKLTFLGDIMLDNPMADNLPKHYSEKSGRYDFSEMFACVHGLLKNSDYVFANLETPVSRDGSGLTCKQWEFCAPFEFAEAVKESGVDFVATANNHCMDRGLPGLSNTVKSLDALGFHHCGIRLHQNDKNYVTAFVGSLKIGVLAYTYGTNAFSNHRYLPAGKLRCVNMLQAQEECIKHLWLRVFHGRFKRVYRTLSLRFFPDNEGKQVYEKRTVSCFRRLLIKRDIRRMKREKVDFLVAYLHIGGQYNTEPSEYTKRTSRWFQNHGCNAVICNHEHVIHGMELYKDGITAYALGNVIGSAGTLEKPYDRRSEYSIALHAYLDVDGSLKKVTFSVLKTRLSADGKLEVWPADELLMITEGQIGRSLRREILMAAEDFSGISFPAVLHEFPVFDGGGGDESAASN